MFGLILLIGGIGLFLVGKLRPTLRRDSDSVFAVIGIVCGLILMTHYDLSFALLLQQMLLIGSIMVLMWDNIRMRAVATDREKRSPRMVDEADARPRGRRRVYRAELDDYDSLVGAAEERSSRQRTPDSWERSYAHAEHSDDEWDTSPMLERVARRERLYLSDRSADHSPRPHRDGRALDPVDEPKARSVPEARASLRPSSPNRYSEGHSSRRRLSAERRQRRSRLSQVGTKSQASEDRSAEGYVDFEPLDPSDR